ncbi:alpha/beta hydrolase [Actinoplanes sp. TFC3]|uniref:alpha/beta hydrolase n=1 Tax=Actinoplanes sp. TFC3 TaxID=1710355 RepID=UPI001F2FC44B
MDLFRDEDIAFAQRLMAAVVPTELHVHPGSYHAAEMFAPVVSLRVRTSWREHRHEFANQPPFYRDRDVALIAAQPLREVERAW